MSTGPHRWGLSLRQAALTVGFAYLLDPVAYAEFRIYPKLVIHGNAEQTVANITAHHGQFLALFFIFFINFALDIVIAWGLYVLLAPVNRALALLASIFQWVYAAICFVGLFNLLPAYRMLTAPEYLADFGRGPLHAQANLLIHTFRYDYSMALVLFGIHLVLVGYLIFRSSYLPRWLGIVLVVDGAGWIINQLQPYLYPGVDVGFLFITFFGEIIFMLWLLIMGWRIKEPLIVAT